MKSALAKKNEASEESKATEKGTNLWSNLLKESVKRATNPDATCIMVGNAKCGKNLIAEAVCAIGNDGDDSTIDKEIVSYCHFDVDEANIETSGTVGIWCFGEYLFDDAFQILGTANNSEKLMLMIALDLSKPEGCLPALHHWLLRLSEYIKKHFDAMNDPEKVRAHKEQFVRYLSHVRIHKGDAEKHAAAAAAASSASIINDKNKSNASEDDKTTITTVKESEAGAAGLEGEGEGGSGEMEEPVTTEGYEFILANFAMPIVVVGCKADTINMDTSAAAKQAKDLQASLRAVCLDIGASLVFTSAVQDWNCVELRKHILHRLYPEEVSMDLEIYDVPDRTFVPAGFDAIELINLASGLKLSPDQFPAKFDELRKHVKMVYDTGAREGGAGSGSPEDEAPDFSKEMNIEQDWLNSLYTFIQQVSATAGGDGEQRRGSSSSSAFAPEEGAGDGEGGEGPAVSPLSKLAARRQGEHGRSVMGGLRRQSTHGTKPGEKKDVGDFFKNLLKK